MRIRTRLQRAASHIYQGRPWLREALVQLDSAADRLRHGIAGKVPLVIQPDPRSLFVAVTSRCNFRCKGCHYGRDFMAGSQLPLPVVEDLLDDAKAIGFNSVRLYGGEPLLHRDLPAMVAHARKRGVRVWLTTNGLLLRQKIDALFEAGLRYVTLGFYGNGPAYDAYVQREGAFARVEDGVAYCRRRYGSRLELTLDWVLMRPTATPQALDELSAFTRRHRLPLHVNLIHYSLPYFLREDEDDGRELHFRREDRPLVEAAVERLLALKATDPEIVPQNAVALRSIPDWIAKGPAMRVPCDRYRLVWVGPDGTVQLCYVTFKLGNLNETRLRDLVYNDAHRKAARDAFALRCPNCFCGYDKRVMGHGPTRRRYLRSGAHAEG